MKKYLLFLGVALCATFCVNEASAQIKLGENGGQLSVSLDSNNIYYQEDKKLEEFNMANKREKEFGSNNYLKVDYGIKRFSAGLQVDAFLPALSGYDISKHKFSSTYNTAFVTLYAQWEHDSWGIRLGDIYDQFGNGLIFRAYEERALGFNNALEGVRFHYNYENYLNFKVLAGLPRIYDEMSDTLVWGGDLSLSFSDMLGWTDGLVSIEGGYIRRVLNNDETIVNNNFYPAKEFKEDVLNMISTRANFEYAGFSLRGEYAMKLNEDVWGANDEPAKGDVINIDFGYNYKRFSISGTFRRQQNMATPIMITMYDREKHHIDAGAAGSGIALLGGGNSLNYIPLLTRQHTYSLASLNPYLGCATTTGGEIGGQVDVYYSWRNPKVRGKYWNFHANFSMFNSLDYTDPFGYEIKGKNAWIDANFDVERQWNKTLKTTFLYSYQRWDKEKSIAPKAKYIESHIFVGDVTYKINKKHSLRFEAQYLCSDDYEGDWVAGTIEYNFAPMFSFYVSDMWNCEETDYNYNQLNDKHYLMHYYQVGATFTHSNYRAQIAYGRNRAGYVCSGGSCRYQPAYTGVNFALTITF